MNTPRNSDKARADFENCELNSLHPEDADSIQFRSETQNFCYSLYNVLNIQHVEASARLLFHF